MKQQVPNLQGSAPGPRHMLWLLVWCLCGAPNCGSPWVSDSSACSSYPFPPAGLPCPASVWGIFTLLYCICFVVFGCCLLEVCCFLKGDEGEWNWEREEVGSSRDRGNCGSDILDERRICFQGKKKSKVHSVINFHKCIPILPGLSTIDSSLKNLYFVLP